MVEQTLSKINKGKTWKRELGFLFFLVLCYLIYWESLEALAIVVTPFVLFISAAFGLDAVSKQLMKDRNNANDSFEDSR